MRRSLLPLAAAVLLSGACAQAQYDPSVEGFGGFSILSIGEPDRDQTFGWQASGVIKLTPHVGFVADFGGQYHDVDFDGFELSVSEFEYLFGPRVSTANDEVNSFAHMLLGGIHRTFKGPAVIFTPITVGTDNGFMVGLGGGVDYYAWDWIGLRLIQFDWLPARIGGEWTSTTARVGFGVTIR